MTFAKNNSVKPFLIYTDSVIRTRTLCKSDEFTTGWFGWLR